MRNSKISQLLAANASPPAALDVRNVADNGIEIMLYDPIDAYFGVSAKAIASAIGSDKARPVTLRINSPGGDVFEGRAIASILRGHAGPTKVVIDGLAASAATTVAIAAKTVEMADGAFFMVHRSWAWTAGNKNDLLELAALLEKIDGEIAADYARKTGGKLADMLKMMDAETWLTATEAKDMGFVDAVVEAPAQFKNFNLEAFERAPEKLIAAMKVASEAAPGPTPDQLRAAAERRLRLYAIPA
jgi:ATP-dependent Clp protease, protease subunit